MSNNNSNFDLCKNFIQAHILFSIAIITAVVSISISLIGVGEILFGNVLKGTEMIMGGLTINIKSIQLAKEINDQVNKN